MSNSGRSWKPGRPVLLTTERFSLESMTKLQAARATYAWSFDPEIMHPLGFSAGNWSPYRWFKSHKKFNNRNKFMLAIRPKGSRKLIGYERCYVSPNGIGFLTVAIGDRSWWGRGVVLETRAAIIDFLFEDVGCQRIWGTPTARNFPSIYNYQALGFTYEGTLRRNAYDHGRQENVDSLMFAMLREEWLAQRAKKPETSQPETETP